MKHAKWRDRLHSPPYSSVHLLHQAKVAIKISTASTIGVMVWMIGCVLSASLSTRSGFNALLIMFFGTTK